MNEWDPTINIKGPPGDAEVPDPLTVDDVRCKTQGYFGDRARIVGSPDGMRMEINDGDGGWAIAEKWSVSEPPPPPPNPPTGLFYLPVNGIKSDILLSPQVDGVVATAIWADIESVEGVYNFSSTRISGLPQSLDTQLSLVYAANVSRIAAGLLPLVIRIDLGIGHTWADNRALKGYKPTWLRGNILTAGRRLFRFCQGQDATKPSQIPTFWDPAFLDGAQALFQALAAHLSALSDTTVQVIHIPYCSASGSGWDVGDVRDVDDTVFPGTPQTRWEDCLSDGPYHSWAEAVVAAGTRLFHDAKAAFNPYMFVQGPIGRMNNYVATMNPDGAMVYGRNVALTVFAAAIADNAPYIGVMRSDLNAGGVQPVPPADPSDEWNDFWMASQAGCFTSAQMIAAAFKDMACATLFGFYGAQKMNYPGGPCIDSTQALKQAIDNGLSYNTEWQEIWEPDILNLGTDNADPNPGSTSDVIEYGHEWLLAHHGPPPTIPLAPSGLLADAILSTQINLSWTDNSNNEQGFKIERSTDNVTFGEIRVTTANVTSYADTGLNPSTLYYYRIRAYNAIGDSAYSTVSADTTLDPPPPAAPTGLSVSEISSSELELSWTDNANNEDGFRIERSLDGASYTEIDSIAADSESYNDTGLDPDTLYYYRVRAFNAYGNSGYSNPDSATTIASAPPDAPSDLIAAAASLNEIDLNWTDNSSNEDGFQIERSSDQLNWALVAVTAPDAVSFTDTLLSPASTYYYRVRAFLGSLESDYCTTASATTGAALIPSQTTETYRTVNGINLKATIFTTGSSPKRCVLAIHGGGYAKGGVSSYVAQTLAATGLFFVVAPEYRMSPPHTEMNSPPHPSPGQNTVGDTGYYPEQADDIAACIAHYRGDSRCNGEVVVVGGSSGSWISLYLAAIGTAGVDSPDLVAAVSPLVTNFADPNVWGIALISGDLPVQAAMANFLHIPNSTPNPPTGSNLILAQTASAPLRAHAGMPPIFLLPGSKDACGVYASTGLNQAGYHHNNTAGSVENGANGMIPALQANGFTESNSAGPEAATYKLWIIPTTSYKHAFDLWDQARSTVVPFLAGPIP